MLANIAMQEHKLGTPSGPLPSTLFQLFEESASHPTAKLTVRLVAAYKWTSWAREYGHESIFRAYAVALALHT